MPGVSLVCDLASPIESKLAAILSVGEDGNRGGISLSVLWRDPHVALLLSGYPEYPIRLHETEDYLICIEGLIYQAPESPWYRSLPAIVTDLRSGDHRALDRAARWIEGMDGDFVIVILDRRSNDVVILNDVLGRLPLYLHRTDETLIVSRELSIVVRARGGVSFDRLAVAEHLLYGYPLGPRTLFKGIERVAPSAAIQVQRPSKRIVISTLQVPSVAPDPRITEEAVEDTAMELSSAFVRACAARAASAKSTVLSLSGGLDSRSVAAGLMTSGVPFTAVTRCTNPRDPDVRLAAKVASTLRLNWKAVKFSRPTGDDLLRLLRLKGGMNHLGMAFILPFFDLVKGEYGREMVFFTGDGGDKILPDHRPKTEVSNLEALVHYILAKHEVLPLRAVAGLTGVSVLDIVTALEERLRSYPEDGLEDKHVHFVLFERAFKWLFEGEDRNRHFFWSASPFYGREAFRLAMRCPGRFKVSYSLYRRFMESLNPNLIDIESTTCGPSLRLKGHPINQLGRTLRRWSPRFVRQTWRRLTKPSVAEVVLDCIRVQLASSSVTTYLSPSHANMILKRVEPTQAYMLFTLTSTIEYFMTGHGTLEHHRDSYF